MALTRPVLMGIVNITPDSFSGDGQLAGEAVHAADRLVADGADWLDLGAESTRPRATPLTSDAEWQRLQPVLQALVQRPWRGRVRLSIDTRHATTAAQALALGADVINDVGGLADAQMLAVLAAARCDVVVMHAPSVPADPALTLPPDCDVLARLLQWKGATILRAAAAGLDPARLILDPGIGFGKTAQQSLALVQGARTLVASGGRWLFGHSRKSFLRLFTEAEAGATVRDDLTLALSAQLAAAGVHVLRVHAVRRHAALLDSICRAVSADDALQRPR
ncbi:MAG: dihydropteroate synthase [Rubrivivax sp.]